MKKILFSVLTCSFLTFSAWSVDLNYPQKEINGKQYYEYVVQKSEGFYSICKKFGVTEEEIKTVNPGTEHGLTYNATILVPVKVASYTTHVVDKKETLYSLSKKYDVTYDDLYALNPSLKTEGLKYGTEVKIPTKKTISGQNMTVSDTVSVVKKVEKPTFVIHEVKKGETLFGICRENGITSEEIIRLNPDVKDGVKVGQKLIIPPVHSNTALTDKSVESKVPKKFSYHTVKKKETLFGICQQYNVTQEEVLKLNPLAKDGIKVNMVLVIPPSYAKPVEGTNAVVDSMSVDSASAPLFIPETTPKKEINMAIVLPYQLNKIANVSQIDGNTEKFLEFYQGALLAVDTLRKMGLSFNMNVFDSGKTEADIAKVLKNQDMENLDFVIGPAYTSQMKAMSEFAKENDVKMLIPFSSKSDDTKENPNIFQVNTPLDQLNFLMAELFIKNFSNKHVVLVKFNNTKEDKKAFGDTLAAMMTAKGMKFSSVNFSTLSAIRTELVANKENVVVPLTANQVSLSQVLPMVNMLNADGKKVVSLFGFSEWQNYPGIAKDLFMLDTYIISPFFTDFQHPATTDYLKRFRKYYNAEPVNSQPQYGMLGYDLMFYFAHAISNYGHDFEHGLDKIRLNGVQSHFAFNKFEEGGYYNSNFLLLMHNRKEGVTLVDGSHPEIVKPLLEKQKADRDAAAKSKKK
ncbi:MAG: LysM peptidoglycan-binding domain-containing protein [Paludibacteraceae bacterium]|nr:LysM peptidoglycan-binding domain-containing protein [Paludibacteraceae bacterium]